MDSPTSLFNKTIVLLQIGLNCVLIIIYLLGFTKFGFYRFGWISILIVAILILIDSHFVTYQRIKPRTIIEDIIAQTSQIPTRWWLIFLFFLSFLSFIPILGWAALFLAIKFCMDDIIFLIKVLKNPLEFQSNQSPSKVTRSSRSNSDPTIIDVEAK
jgi:hypothetical protein